MKFIASDSLRPGTYLDGGSLIEAAVDDLYLYESVDNGTGVDLIDNLFVEPKLIRVTDYLGREVNPSNTNGIKNLIYYYDDGTVDKRLIY